MPFLFIKTLRASLSLFTYKENKMAKVRGPVYTITGTPKKTSQGNGTYSRKPHSGGETFYDGHKSGTTPR